ncbi:UDP-2,4-diacetamido-2,4,6-trideoxy-beta-L-altropyranose hydrolase [Shinella zoogloeoides]|uniref:UDP-2,4-diacetamido-2,4, 6-trideoxy-beta-L-altropyranose hydrolase n=1 Tax=Shinella zoogloeoides TaxID=352475 RepID=A0A6N8TJ96_SHIZO|nr:UDP-2,4-diacetamido-2,4,6-trideoxy-beta-L-altropyranose hydrolase [Shinella zoogloeoides]MXO02741.1 UDP-2,4-diacetamido-2,4,6-trideoxy-beta-L-altropyranose hydrolase [Shinella zoogloeoides]UEX80997.1 UDP-2,4-diacetamido-2,4,6-trideoxy-beta-L-altropyranose hydrolase [Shinella zoogloeoides]
MTHDSRQPKRIAFRTDASVEIGTGHVMRCLTLADALREDGAECLFLCRRHEGNLLELIAGRGYKAIALPRPDALAAMDCDAPPHAHWLGTNWATDAQDSLEALAGVSTDWMVVDHYALDRRWEQAVRPSYRRLLVIDDLADRPHDCDLLLDQSLGRRVEDYCDLLPPDAQTLIGPRYALLRPEFAALRAESLARREQSEFKHLLITMGGVDKDNATGAILDALGGCELPPDLRITVVMGPHAPFLAQVRAKAAAMPRPTRVLVGVHDMARLMTDADFAIGAAGSTSWERCCLGLPTIQLVLAENQKEVAAAFAELNAVIAIPTVPSLQKILPKLLKDPAFEQLRLLSRYSSGICDGLGVLAVIEGMLQETISLGV